MKTMIVAAAFAAALTAPVPAQAQSGGSAPVTTAEEVRLLRDQLNALSDRLDRLERSNGQLEAQNAELRAHVAPPAGVAPSASPQAAAGPGSAMPPAALGAKVAELEAELDQTVAQLAQTRANAPEWASRFTFRGDLRYRHERIVSAADRVVVTPGQLAVGELDRARDRIRLRFGGTFKVNDTMTVAMRLATGSEDPRSANATLTDAWSRKSFGVDQAFVAWQPTEAWLVRAGKMPMPWTRPAVDLFFDNDLNPEGVAVNYSKGVLFANASYLWVQERGPTLARVNAGATELSDPTLALVQAGIRYPMGEGASLLAGLAYQDHFAVQGRRPWFGLLPNGNSTVPAPFPAGSTTLVQVARYDYDIVHAFAQYERKLRGDLPLTLFGQYARNGDAEFDTAWTVGALLGRASKPRTWEVGALYQTLGKDALFGQWVDSNFGAGITDTRGWAVRAIYAPAQNVTLNAAYFINELNVDDFSPSAPRNRDFRRLQLDANFRF